MVEEALASLMDYVDGLSDEGIFSLHSPAEHHALEANEQHSESVPPTDAWIRSCATQYAEPRTAPEYP